MKKPILLFLLCLLLCGCGRQTAPAEAPTPTPTETAAPAPTPSPTPTPTPTPTPAPTPAPEPPDDALVNVADYIPTIHVDLRYATTRNCSGAVIYDFTDAQLRYGTVKKLSAAQETVLSQGYSLLIWDAYRPVSAQFKLWEICPDNTYVANPYTGFSRHSRGDTVDIALVTADGAPVALPSDFDEFSALADRDYTDVSAEAAANADLLDRAMTQAGFVGYSGEWWHYSDSVKYDVIQ